MAHNIQGGMTEIFNKKQFTSLRKTLRAEMTKGERVLWSRIKNSQLNGWKFRRQCGIGRFVVDFYCPQLKLVVEIDGSTHNEGEVFEKDRARQKFLESLGLTVKRYNGERVFYELDEVLDDLYRTCESLATKPPPTPPS